ncbi:homeotic protein caudal [Anopheles darlingi]|uniref:homeotic protein caudal n=1 Tax=Anopheles darlingi TaxID=43151 RepID=UPI0021003AB1|nr:homeotic protein caudal [Anopheles darlingi]
MVSYYNHFAMYPKNHSGNLSYSATSGWYPSNYQHQPPHAQFIGDGESSPQPMYYPHPHVFHPQSSPDWSGHENFPTPPQTTLLPHGPSPGSGGAGGAGAGGGLGGGVGGGGIGLNLAGPGANHLHHHHHHHHSSNSSGSGGGGGAGGGGGGGGGSNNAGNNGHNDHLADGLHSIPSPPITVSGSDMSSPGAPTGSASPQITPRPTPVKSPYEWMKKQSYQSQPNPGKTRTKDKYRVVYTDQQRLELEKEFHYTRYITIRRKSELAQNLQLSERQVKIWFQNRRAKDRKQKKKAESGSAGTGGTGGGPGSIGGGIIGGGAGGVGGSGGGGGLGMVGGPHHHHHHHHLGPQSLVAHSQSGGQNHPHSLLVDTKPKLEPSLHLSHLHQMSAMSMGMGSMGLHHPAHHHLHPHLGVPTASQHLNSVQGGPGSQVPTSLSIM